MSLYLTLCFTIAADQRIADNDDTVGGKQLSPSFARYLDNLAVPTARAGAIFLYSYQRVLG